MKPALEHLQGPVGSNNMNTKYTMFGVMTILSTVLCSPLIMAQQAEKANVEVKCFVELYGGGHTIYFARLSDKEYQKLPKTLANRKLSSVDSTDKVKVYAVKECTLEDNKFKSLAANNLEKTMPK